MSSNHERRVYPFLVLCFVTTLVAACGGSSDDPGITTFQGGERQTATATATPSSGTIARGATTSTTVVFAATGGITFTSTGTYKQYSGISVDFTSTQTVGTTITRTYTIGADASVPAGVHEVRFTAPISGATGTVSTPVAIFRLTVTP